MANTPGCSFQDRIPALLVGEVLAKLNYLDEAIGRLSVEIDRVIAPFARQVELLDTIPGIDRRCAEAIIAEIGVDMSRFGHSARLASWAGVCPGPAPVRRSPQDRQDPQGLPVAPDPPQRGRQGPNASPAKSAPWATTSPSPPPHPQPDIEAPPRRCADSI